MRIARTLMLALAAAIAAMAFASTANAEQMIEAVNEDTEQDCSVAAENCEIVAHSEPNQDTVLTGHFIGIEAIDSTCHDEFTGYLGADGEGHLTDQTLEGDDCTRTPCEGDEAEWPVRTEETGTNELNMEIEFCLEDEDEVEVHCELDVHVEVMGHHSAEFSADNQRCHHVEGTSFDVEVDGHWETEAGESDEIEIVHHQ
jgi:hypothetical protein